MSAPAPAPASMSEAMAMARAAQDYMAAADPAAMTAQAQAEYLRAQEQHDAVSTATRARVLAAFTAGHGYTADADYSPTSWLIHQTRITRAAARAHLAWSRRVDGHPRVIAALAEGDVLTDSMAATICGWIDKIPRDCRDAADQILIAAARAGARQQDLAELAAEIYARSLQDTPDDDEPRFEDRKVTVQTTIYGAGLINGDLTPDCAAVVTAVLESLSAPQRIRGHPDEGAALPRRAGRGHDPADRGRAAPGPGRAAGQGHGARVAARAAGDGRRVGPARPVDHRRPRPLGRAPGRRVGGRQRRRRLAGGGRGPGHDLRRLGDPRGHRRGRRHRPG